MSQLHNTVFISYRRSVSAYIARAIYGDLKTHGYDVFMDVQNIDSGTFDTIILRQIEARAHFVLVCAPGSFDRVNQPGDWLRREIEHALDHERNIVPIIVNDFAFDDKVQRLLTGKLAEISRYNGVNAPHDYFEEAMTRLRTRFLKQPVSGVIVPIPVGDRHIVEAKQREVERQLSAEEFYNRGNERAKARDFNGAVADYTEAIRLNPEFADAYGARGLTLHRDLGNPTSAIADFDQAIRLSPRFIAAYNNRALARYVTGDYDGAIADSTEAIRIEPTHAPAYTGRGLARRAKGDLHGALVDFDQAIQIDPLYAAAFHGRAKARYANNDNRGALADYQRYLDVGGGTQYNNQAEVEERIREIKQKLGR